MEITRARQDRASTQPPELSKHSRIVLLLSAFGVRRQAKLDQQDYQVYASDLEPFNLEDIEAVLRRLSEKPREEYEPAFPDLATIVHAIKNRQQARETRIRPEQLRPEARQAIADAEEYKRLGAEDLEPISLADLIPQGLLGMESHRPTPAKATTPPELQNTCPHCGNQGSPQSSAMLRRLSEYYAKRAANAEEMENNSSTLAAPVL